MAEFHLAVVHVGSESWLSRKRESSRDIVNIISNTCAFATMSAVKKTFTTTRPTTASVYFLPQKGCHFWLFKISVSSSCMHSSTNLSGTSAWSHTICLILKRLGEAELPYLVLLWRSDFLCSPLPSCLCWACSPDPQANWLVSSSLQMSHVSPSWLSNLQPQHSAEVLVRGRP